MVLTTNFFIINILLILIGILLLLKSSDYFIIAASYIAKTFHVPEIVIGLTVVSIGTSLPELATNLYSSISGSSGIALGNVIGSNITNILLGLSLSIILLKKIKIDKKFFFRDVLFMSFIFILFGIFIIYPKNTNLLNRYESLTLLILAIIYIIILIKSRNKEDIIAESDFEEETIGSFKVDSLLKSVSIIFGSILVIVFSTKLTIDNSVWLAIQFDIPESIIAATIIAIGTSLPEIAVSVSGIKNAKPEMALGNIIGSCIFNIVLVMGLSSLISPVAVDINSLNFLLPSMLLTGFILVAFILISKLSLKRWQGYLMLFCYIIFILYNVNLVIT